MEWSGHAWFEKARGMADGKGQKGNIEREETGKGKGGGKEKPMKRKLSRHA